MRGKIMQTKQKKISVFINSIKEVVMALVRKKAARKTAKRKTVKRKVSSVKRKTTKRKKNINGN